jgi:hypothetical protein
VEEFLVLLIANLLKCGTGELREDFLFLFTVTLSLFKNGKLQVAPNLIPQGH